MRRINIYIDDELDARAEREARRRKMSKAALIRRSLETAIGASPVQDPVDELIGLSNADPVLDIDAIVYE